MDLTGFVDAVGADGPVTIAGAGTRGGAASGVRCVAAPSGIDWIQADEMTVCCGAGTPVDELRAALAEVGQRTVLPAGGTVGGALAVGRSDVRRLGDGHLRDALLQTHYVGATGELVRAGGPTVKNVSGFDVCRLLVGARGTLGFFGDVLLRTRPIAPCSLWFTAPADDRNPEVVLAALYRPVAVLWDGTAVWALLEGHPDDVHEQARRCHLVPCDGPPVLPPVRRVVAPAEQVSIGRRLGAGSFVAELGTGVLHTAPGAIATTAVAGALGDLAARVKLRFDPEGRLNPGVVVG